MSPEERILSNIFNGPDLDPPPPVSKSQLRRWLEDPDLPDWERDLLQRELEKRDE